MMLVVVGAELCIQITSQAWSRKIARKWELETSNSYFIITPFDMSLKLVYYGEPGKIWQ